MALRGFWLVRHALTVAASGVAVGSGGVLDLPLGEEGRAQARALAAQLARRPLSAVCSSDSRRAVETAEAIAAVHGLPVRRDERLRELDFGAWEGRRLADLWREEPANAAAWEADVRAAPASFGESVAELEARLAAFLEDARAALAGEVALVAHGGSLAVLRSLITGAPLESTLAERLEPGGVAWVGIGGELDLD
jgi:2,3-bisphosphoglycerate-dependent phosphoglycerate mutase